MICYQCVLKHLAGALSYGKEIISGHTLGASLDHRIDFLGEIINSEHHLELMDINLYNQISNYRKELQSRKILINANDLEFIRNCYNKIEQLESGIEITSNNNYDVLTINPDIVFYDVNNINYFDLSYKSIKKNLIDFNKIKVLKSSVDLSKYDDVEIVNQSIKDYAINSDDFILFYQNNVVLKQFSAKKIENSFSMKKYDNVDVISFIKKNGVDKVIYNYDYLKPAKIKTSIFNKVIKNYHGDYPVTVYCYLGQQTTLLNDNMCTVNVDRNICCSTKNELKIKFFARFNENGFESLKKFLDYK